MQVLRFGLNAPTAPDAFGREIAVIGNPVLAVVMAFIGVLITLVLAHLSYRYFETPIMQADKRRVVRQAPKAEPARRWRLKPALSFILRHLAPFVSRPISYWCGPAAGNAFRSMEVMAARRPAKDQPESFEWTAENKAWCEEQIRKYPEGRQASAVIPFLWRGQKQEGWCTIPMMEAIARQLGMPYIRVYEVATFYTMFNLAPVGEFFVQLCGTTPCMLRGAHDLREVCKKIDRSGKSRQFRRRQIFLARSRMPRRLLQCAHGADFHTGQRSLLRRPDAGKFRAAAKRFAHRQRR